jgi:hypothetical protein
MLSNLSWKATASVESVAYDSTILTDIRTWGGYFCRRRFVPRRHLEAPATFRRLLYLYRRADISIKEIDNLELMCPVNDSHGESPTGITSSDHILRKQFYESAHILVWGTWQRTEVINKRWLGKDATSAIFPVPPEQRIDHCQKVRRNWCYTCTYWLHKAQIKRNQRPRCVE